MICNHNVKLIQQFHIHVSAQATSDDKLLFPALTFQLGLTTFLITKCECFKKDVQIKESLDWNFKS